MPPTLLIAVRFIVSRKRSMLMSLAGIVFGVGFFIITQAQTSGFEKFYIETIIGTDSPMRIPDRFRDVTRSIPAEEDSDFLIESSGTRAPVDGIEYPQRLREAVQSFNGVTAVSEVLRSEATGVSNAGENSVMVNGIRLRDHTRVTNVEDQIIKGDISDFEINVNSAMVAIKLARKLKVDIGDYVVVKTPFASRRYRVATIFESGVDLIDRRRIFVHLNEARTLFQKPFGNTLFQVGLRDPYIAETLAAHMEETLDHKVISWQEREKTWLQVFQALRASSAITVSTIILISGLGMFNTLAMLVMEKTREIAILRSMGYTRRDVIDIFLWQGVIVLAAGIVVGWGFGASITYAISKLPIRIRGIFSTDSFVVNWDFNHYIWAAIIAAVVVMIASYLPARRAAKLEPGSVIRGNSA